MSFRERLRKIADALDERLGHRKALAATLYRPLRPSVAHSLGAALLFAVALQVVTGIALASTYAPTTTDAWGSVYHIQHHVTLGWYVRGLHHFGSSAVVVLSVLHLVQVVAFAAYRRPREANWLIGLVMLALVLGLALTGYLLPWDQHGYWSSQVAVGIIEQGPFGDLIATALRGGPELGNATLTRFYALHALLLPVLLGGLVLVHVALYLKHGPKARPYAPAAAVVGAERPYHPYQLIRDALVSLTVFALLTALALTVGVGLEAPADPASDFEARPEWYFRFLYQLLKLFEGPMVLVGTTVLPALAALFLVGVPWLDRKTLPERGPSRRVWVPLALMLLAVIGLTAWSYLDDADNAGYQKALVKARAASERASALAATGGVDGDGRVVLFSGQALYVEEGCAGCHDDPEVAAPRLSGYGTAERFHAFIRDPDGERFFAGTPLEGEMSGYDLARPQADALLAYLRDPASAPEAGRRTFLDEGCSDCHNDPALSPRAKNWDIRSDGPELAGYQGYEWTRELIRDATHPRYFGDMLTDADLDDAMPPYPDLGSDELDLIVRWLLAGAPGAR